MRSMMGVGILIRKGSQYLLTKRATDPDASLWSIPGGIVEVGERTTDAVVREETSLTRAGGRKEQVPTRKVDNLSKPRVGS